MYVTEDYWMNHNMDSSPKTSNKTQRKEVYHKFKLYIVSQKKDRSTQGNTV